MNERIREIAEQASHQSPDGYPVTIPYSKDFAEKFAELIVRECVKVAGPEDSYTDEWFRAKADSVNKIKQHFGVEE